jgi:F0F1-type ATP synthase beta subunit
MTEHEELLAIHAICMDVANCPEEKEGDTLTVKMIKRITIFANHAQESSENFVELARRYEKAKDTISEQDRILRSVIEKTAADNGGTVPGWLLDLAP